MQENKKQWNTILSACIVLVLVFISGTYVGYNHKTWVQDVAGIAHTSPDIPLTTDFEPFWKAWSILDQKFPDAEKVSDQDKVWGAISGLTNAYGDPYTEFFPPAEAKKFSEQINNEFSGVGMEVGIKDGILTVIAPLKGSPAEKAGIRPGDKIIKIDSKITTDVTVEEAVTMIKGKAGTTVTLNLYREGDDQPFDVTLTRAVINIPSIEMKKRDDGIYVLNIYNFGVNVADDFKKEITSFKNDGGDKLIIDLRGNPGGFLEAAVDIASWFLPQGEVIVSEDYGTNREPDIYRSKGYNIFDNKVKIVLLVDEGSASASEILAGALSEHKRATLIGERTYGKGSVQELVPITKDTSLKVTVAKWLTPNGVSISEKGLLPDIVVPVTKEDIIKKFDAQLDRAVKFLIK